MQVLQKYFYLIFQFSIEVQYQKESYYGNSIDKQNVYVIKNVTQSLIDSNQFDSTFLLANLAVIQRNFIEAKKLLSRALEIDPNLIEANNNLGNIFVSTGLHSLAIKHFVKAIKSPRGDQTGVPYNPLPKEILLTFVPSLFII